MQKKMLTKTDHIFTSYESLDKFVKSLLKKKSELISLGAQDIRVNCGVEWCFGDADGRFDIIYEILETDEELQSRIDRENAQINYKRSQYEQLKKELGL